MAACVGEAECGVLEVQDGRLYVGCGRGLLELMEVQMEGKKRMVAAEFLRGFQVKTVSGWGLLKRKNSGVRTPDDGGLSAAARVLAAGGRVPKKFARAAADVAARPVSAGPTLGQKEALGKITAARRAAFEILLRGARVRVTPMSCCMGRSRRI